MAKLKYDLTTRGDEHEYQFEMDVKYIVLKRLNTINKCNFSQTPASQVK